MLIFMVKVRNFIKTDLNALKENLNNNDLGIIDVIMEKEFRIMKLVKNIKKEFLRITS